MNNEQVMKIPMNTNYLPQIPRVNELVNLIVKSLNDIENTNLKNEILCTLSAFNYERTVCSLSLIELLNKARENNIDMTVNEACKVLALAAIDIEQNYASKALDYHLDAFIAEKAVLAHG